MFDTMKATKIVAGLCGALLFFLLVNWAATALYSMGGEHGGEEHASYVIETEESDSTEAAADAGPSVADLMAQADGAKGAKVFGKCKACHKLEKGANATGPYLYGVVGRPVDTAEGYRYSGALEKVVDVWTPENLFHFLENPKAFAPGTKMGFAGLKSPEDRANLITYLDELDGTKYVDPNAAEAAPAAAAPAEAAPAAPASDSTEAAADAGPSVADLVAQADIAKGAKVFNKCKACHKLEKGANATGPYLYGVVGRPVDTAEGYRYSGALEKVVDVWTPENLFHFLENPKAFAPGTKMGFAGLKKPEDRANLIAYLDSLDN